MATATWIEGNSPGGSHGSRLTNKSLEQTQAQVDQVVGTMKMNLTNVLERDQRLSHIDDRATALQVLAYLMHIVDSPLSSHFRWAPCSLSNQQLT